MRGVLEGSGRSPQRVRKMRTEVEGEWKAPMGESAGRAAIRVVLADRRMPRIALTRQMSGVRVPPRPPQKCSSLAAAST